ncbi:MAG: ATP-binding protein [Cyclobacteriaceae bacterium]|nr:ATP-binding protein [Cyclobacteriaceae bacterium]
MKVPERSEPDIKWLKENCYNDPEKRIRLKKGEILLSPGELNHRLFLILSGRLVGYITDEQGIKFEIFNSTQDMFIGAYSFFDHKHQSYSTVVAMEDTEVAYLDYETYQTMPAMGFREHILPVIVNEIYLRQLSMQQLNIERHQAIKKLYQAEKMATLGQMAAGVAHELNNAIGVIKSNSEWLTGLLEEQIGKLATPLQHDIFVRGVEKGSRLSTSKIREVKKEIISKYDVGTSVARNLAKMDLDEETLQRLIKQGKDNLAFDQLFFEVGSVLHDFDIASRQAMHVLRSVRELGAAKQGTPREVDLKESIKQSLSLLKRILENTVVTMEVEDGLYVVANPGDLVQIWVNLIKNAVESMQADKTPQAEVKILSSVKKGMVQVIISDNGPGIPERIKKSIFQPNVTTKVGGLAFGLGLGLPIVQKIITGYGGTIDAQSRPGLTEFIIRLNVIRKHE